MSAGPAQPHMNAEAGEGLAHELVRAEGGLTSEPAAAVRPRELADGWGTAIDQGKGGIMRHPLQGALPQPLLHRPEVGRLAHEGGPMDTSERREEMGVLPTEVGGDRHVLIESQELAHDFQRQDLTVGQHGRRPTRSQPCCRQFPQSVINGAARAYNEPVQVHARPPRW
jgi:hypothetical protein